MTTTARVFTEGSSHWYHKDGKPCYELPKADGKGMKAPTLADARKLALLPSVTNILGILDKPALTSWKIEQAVLAVMTSTRKEGEETDAFVKRILQEERVQDQEAARAREVGTQIHDAIEKALTGQDWDKSLAAAVEPVLTWVMTTGRVLWAEKILVGTGYAGRADLAIEGPGIYLIDFKTTSRLPDKDSWLEHKLQTAAYAATLGNTGDKALITGNVYISTKEPGKFAVFTQTDWPTTFQKGFLPVLNFWQWANRYAP